MQEEKAAHAVIVDDSGLRGICDVDRNIGPIAELAAQMLNLHRRDIDHIEKPERTQDVKQALRKITVRACRLQHSSAGRELSASRTRKASVVSPQNGVVDNRSIQS